ncbi:hypothetical protein P691DRAFT_784659 [Macrolepiota fuliginosa MF-IS2]|uniref:Uncharacterized protein n=1 Tax=Macrolepiota fuliginosa MF-IS2 TaxID=1400762 RepID=A0A9P5XAP4_9AGAR|nr:hypothetical protein P691DRAFT_784659 [Macrolepiota fuliginosa MF-IS2]
MSSSGRLALSRDDTLHILKGMNIELTPNTKLPINELERRLENVLDSAQRYTIVFPKVTPYRDKPLSKAFHRNNLAGAFSQREREDPWQNAFERIAGHILTFAGEWEEGGGTLSSVVLKDPVKPHGLVIKIYSIHEVEEKTALMFVGYTAVESPDQAAFGDTVQACLKPIKNAMLYFVTELEQRIVVVFSADLPRRALVLLKDDWKNHKPFCRSVSSGTWYTVTLDRNPFAHLLGVYGPLVNNILGVHVNRFDSGDEIQEKGLSNDAVPENIYDPGEYFLVKIQREVFDRPGQQHRDMLIYDSCKSFEVHMLREREPKVFGAGLAAMGDEMKMYRWACRVGDFQWKICFDRGPDRNPPW